jgi:6-phosphogluconolactonase
MPDLQIAPTPAEAARRAAAIVAGRASAAVAERGAFAVAFSGGSTPGLMLGALGEDLPWSSTTVYQVDERVAPPGHGDRNLTGLLVALPPEAHARVLAMPVEDADLEGAAARYGSELPERLDLVHLGLGADGHTASLVPGDPMLWVHDRAVGLTNEYEGYRRMTLTYPTLDAAREIVWLVTGEEKRHALQLLLGGDRAIPASRVASPRQIVIADEAAAGRGRR